MCIITTYVKNKIMRPHKISKKLSALYTGEDNQQCGIVNREIIMLLLVDLSSVFFVCSTLTHIIDQSGHGVTVI